MKQLYKQNAATKRSDRYLRFHLSRILNFALILKKIPVIT